ncbi:unnamed protein product [Miscanthus lutarioriparius]|uniref:non-specific serine/threonine protein kinase n=1 Tax=Miscanthus lutarioriparius TaxID=422564 RepID=A0A811QGV5_9POAL|nr:unnamed protein product [Miscanthus lutarioriparius]
MAPDPDLAGGEQAEPPDDEVDSTGRYFRLQRLRRGGSHRGGMCQSLQHKHILKLYASWLDKKKRTVNIVTELFTSGNLRENVNMA